MRPKIERIRQPMALILSLLISLTLAYTHNTEAYAEQAASRLQVYNTNYLQYNGQQIALFGMGNFWALSDPGLDYQDMITAYKSDGSNFMRMSLFGHTVAKRTGLEARDVIYPFLRSSTPGANDGGNKFDLTQFNPAYFQRLKDISQFAQQNDVFIMYVIWDEIPLESGTARWIYNPFNPLNNINNLGLPSADAVPEFYNLNNTELLSIQEAFLKEALDNIAQYGNVFFTISNEYTGGPAWHRYWVDLINDYEVSSGINPILTNELEYSGFSPDYTDLISATTTQTGGPDNWRGTRPVVNHKTGPKFESDRNNARKAWWSVFVNGGHTSDDSHDGGDPPDQHNSPNTLLAREQIRYFRNFIETLPYNEMVPAFIAKPGLISTGEARVKLAQDYVVYLKNGGSVIVDLSNSSGTLDIEWYNPREGTYVNQGTVQGGSSQTFNAPDTNDWVLHISRKDIGKWRHYVVELPDNTYSGNPFELEVEATFTHTTSATTLTIPGYYAGNDTWKIGFMPTKIGEWTYVTSSQDSDLDGVSGSITCVESGLPGMLKADTDNPRKWKYADGQYVVPIALRMEFFSEPASESDFITAADFMKNNNIHMLETRLTEEEGQFENGRNDFIFEGDWRNHQFDLRIWDRMEQRMKILTERGLGAHIMFYSDDDGEPGWSGQSDTEKLVIRYIIARLAGYPVVWFNTGIDIAEYRNQSWINWFGQQIRSLDPYGHPVSSRYGGGSGNYVMSGQLFDSRGDRLAIINDMTNYFQVASVPVSMDDAWGENRPSKPSKNFQPEDIRRAFWKCVAAGGLGGLIRGTGDGGLYDGYFYIAFVESDLESEQWLKLINPFVQTKLGDTFGTMVPDQSLVSNGYALTDPARTKIIYFLMGENDRWDSGDGGNVTVKLLSLSGSYTATWFDPRTGNETTLGALAGGSDYVIPPPDTDDWVLLFTKESPGPSGDVNGDTVVDILDLQACVNVFLGTETRPDFIQRAKEAAEPKDQCNVLDVQKIVNIILGA